ncbi:MurR/RpiR family transcriptional regulator [Macrococcus sp. DPC7161]|uniref:MurR/RpiR family transcriptional regulator n=1 Tax=Macrococcus sp. DPC7161 TaxID=2507060 RepID=UPI00100ACECB|nr:MurR/RpiR family transcriptional regulator [Macrococcus sp. DPC7161]RXK17855.1 MurR/RpiR family transcriptional regulator [Macrococcus sp. DPC7161]
MDSLLLSISKRYQQFSSVDRRIADLIIEQPKEIVHMPVKLLAVKACVSESALVRFAKRIGLSGIKQLKVEIAKELHTIDVVTSDEHTVGHMIDEATYYLQFAQKFIQQETISHCAKRISNARKILLFSSAQYQLGIQYLDERLKQLGYTPIYCSQECSLPQYLKYMNEMDLLILGTNDKLQMTTNVPMINVTNQKAYKGREVIRIIPHERLPQFDILIFMLIVEMLIKELKKD